MEANENGECKVWGYGYNRTEDGNRTPTFQSFDEEVDYFTKNQFFGNFPIAINNRGSGYKKDRYLSIMTDNITKFEKYLILEVETPFFDDTDGL